MFSFDEGGKSTQLAAIYRSELSERAHPMTDWTGIRDYDGRALLAETDLFLDILCRRMRARDSAIKRRMSLRSVRERVQCAGRPRAVV